MPITTIRGRIMLWDPMPEYIAYHLVKALNPGGSR